MNIRTTLILFLLAAGLAAWLLLFREHPDEKKVLEVPVLGGHSLKEAVRIRFSRAGEGGPIELLRDEEGPFRVVEPIVDRCSAAFLRNLMASYDAEPLHEAFPDQKLDAKDIAQLGFDEPRATLEAWFPDGSQSKVEIGGEGPLGRDTYVRRDGKIYTGGTGLWSALQVNIMDLRERQVFDNRPLTATSLTVDELRGDKVERVRLVQRSVDSKSAWYMEEPRQGRTELAAVETFVAQVISLRIDSFPPAPVRLPERQPDYTIVVEGSLGNEMVKLWLDPSEQLIGWCERRKVAFTSSDHQYHQIFLNAAERMRARWLIPIPELSTNLVRAVIDQGRDQPRIVLSRQSVGVEFQMQEPVVTACSPTKLNETIQGINNLRVVQYVAGKADDPRFGLASPTMTLEVLGNGDRKPTVLRFGADVGNELDGLTYAQRADEPDQVVAVPLGAVKQLRRPWNVYPELKVMKLLPGAVVELVQVKGHGAETIEYRRKEGRWQRADAPQDWVGNVIDEVADLRGTSVDLSRRLDLGDPDRVIALCRSSGDVFARLSVWDRGPGQPLRARYEGKAELVFELNEGTSSVLRKLWQ